MIYLDSAATSVYRPECVARAVNHALRFCGNPGRSGHKYARDAAEVLYNCRIRAAKLFHMEQAERVIFTMNATHGLNIAIGSLVGAGDKVLVSGFEHNAVMRTLHHIGAEPVIFGDRLFDAEYTIDSLREKLTEGIKCVIVSHVSNVFGFVQPVERIAEICREREVPLILDASQSAGILELDARTLGASFIAMPGHKGLMGPQGTGILLCGDEPSPILYGGTGSLSESMDMPDFLPDRIEAGTQNTPGIAGLCAGMRFIERVGTDRILRHEHILKNRLRRYLISDDRIESYFGGDAVQNGVVSFNIRGLDCETVSEKLSSRGIAVRAGLHCAPLAHKSAGTFSTGTVRVSFSFFNTERDVDALSAAIREIEREKN